MEWISVMEKGQEYALFQRFTCFQSTIKKLKTGMLTWDCLPVCEATGVYLEVTVTPQRPLLYGDGIHRFVTNGDEPQAALKSIQGTCTSRVRAVVRTAWMNMETHTGENKQLWKNIVWYFSYAKIATSPCLQTPED